MEPLRPIGEPISSNPVIAARQAHHDAMEPMVRTMMGVGVLLPLFIPLIFMGTDYLPKDFGLLLVTATTTGVFFMFGGFWIGRSLENRKVLSVLAILGVLIGIGVPSYILHGYIRDSDHTAETQGLR